MKSIRWIGPVVAATVVLAACQPWSSPRFDAAGTGYNSSETVINTSNVGSLAAAKNVTVPGVDNKSFPVAFGDSLFVATSGGTGGVRVYPIANPCTASAAGCEPSWSTAQRGVTSQPTIGDGKLFVAIGGTL